MAYEVILSLEDKMQTIDQFEEVICSGVTEEIQFMQST
jgi:hypothetical protein